MTGGVRSGRHAAIAAFDNSAALATSARLAKVLLLAAWFLLAVCPRPAAHAAALSDGSSSRSARNQAIRSIPWNDLAEPHRRNVQYVVRNASIYRRLPTRVIDCDPDLFTFLLRRPDVVVDVWRLMRISKVSLHRTSAVTFRGTDGAGTSGRVRYVYAHWGANAHNFAVIYADGAYVGKPFMRPLRAKSVLLLQTRATQDVEGRHRVTVRIDSFVHVDQFGVELVARTVQPWINHMADRNYVETVGFMSSFSRTAERNPQGMERLAARLRSVDEPTRRELVRLCYRTSQRYALRDKAQPFKSLVLAQQVGLPASRSN